MSFFSPQNQKVFFEWRKWVVLIDLYRFWATTYPESVATILEPEWQRPSGPLR